LSPNALALSFTGFAVFQNLKVRLYLGQIAEFERKIFTWQIKTEERAGGMPRHARHE
jgi:hypothetical protein